ncbi:MAG TPA: hypothetical protein VHQ39_06825 [Dongiaceae bacterium]|jgi:hypothetical protein|nr:hypothetical protein [Dongiaceae bacterium]
MIKNGHAPINQGDGGRLLKNAVARLIHRVGLDRSAEILKRSTRQLRRYRNVGSPDQITCLDVVKLEAAADAPMVTEFMAHIQGAALLRLPREPQYKRIHTGFAEIGRTIGRLFAGYAHACGNGDLDGKARTGLIALCDEAMTAISKTRARLMQGAG